MSKPARLHPRLLASALRQLADDLEWPEILAQRPELATPAGKAALRRGAYVLENASNNDESWLLTEIVECIPDMIFVKEAENLTFVRVNEAAERLLGLSRDELLGKTDFDFFPEHEARFFQAKDREVLSTCRLLEIPQEEIQTRHGPRVLHTQKIPILDAQGVPRFLAGISRDITALVEAQAEVVRSHAQLRRLSGRLQQAQEEERRYLARELHDELGQILTGLKLELSALGRKLEKRKTPLHLERALQLTDSSLATVRRVATRLRPGVLDDLGLKPALEWLLQGLRQSSSLQIELDYELDLELDSELRTTLYRLCQEAMTNVLRHAQARSVRVRLSRLSERVELIIEDDGKGFDPRNSNSGRLGILGMRERVHLHGGHFDLENRPSGGTRITVHLPLSTKARD